VDVSPSRGRHFANEDQEFEDLNEALRVSCEMGYPVRVVRLAEQNSIALSHSHFFVKFPISKVVPQR